MSTTPRLLSVALAGLLLTFPAGCDNPPPPATPAVETPAAPPATPTTPAEAPACCCDTPSRETAAGEPAAGPDTPAPAQPAEGKRVALNPAKTLFFEKLPDGRRRVLIESEVCLRQGPLELFLCRVQTKEHEAIVHADVDARAIHAALEAAGARAGSVVRYEPFRPPTGTTIRVSVEYVENGKTVTRPAQEWVRNLKTQKAMTEQWVFAGSQFFENPDDKNAPPSYAANGGDVICVSNFGDAMLDLPINSPKDNSDLAFDAFTDRIPPLKTKVMVILEPVK